MTSHKQWLGGIYIISHRWDVRHTDIAALNSIIFSIEEYYRGKEQDNGRRPEKKSRAGGRGKSEAKGHPLQELVDRQMPRGYSRS